MFGLSRNRTGDDCTGNDNQRFVDLGTLELRIDSSNSTVRAPCEFSSRIWDQEKIELISRDKHLSVASVAQAC